MTMSETLMAAKRELETRGWWHGEKGLVSRHTLCVVQAIRAVESADGFLDVSHFFLQVATGQCGLIEHLFKWNDARERTLQDVLDAFDAAIAIARQQEQSVREEVPCSV